MGEGLEEKQKCEHKFVHLKDLGTRETGYRQWVGVDLFFCEKCLEQREVERKLEERRSHAW